MKPFLYSIRLYIGLYKLVISDQFAVNTQIYVIRRWVQEMLPVPDLNISGSSRDQAIKTIINVYINPNIKSFAFGFSVTWL